MAQSTPCGRQGSTRRVIGRSRGDGGRARTSRRAPRLVLASSGTGFWEWDVRTGELIWSETIFLQHGLDPDGESPSFDDYIETIHPDDRERFRAHDRRDARFARHVQPRVPAPLAGRFRPLDPRRRPHLPRSPTARPTRMIGHRHRHHRGAPARGRPRSAPCRRAPRRRLPRGFIDVISHELRTPDHHDLRADPDPRPTRAASTTRPSAPDSSTTSRWNPSVCSGWSRTSWS